MATGYAMIEVIFKSTMAPQGVKGEVEKELSRPAGEISIIKLVDSLLEYAYRERASDIHIDPGETSVKVRFRIDGVMHDVFVLPKDIQSEIVSRIKVLSGLRTDEHQMAQDGRFRFELSKDDVRFDVRVSIAPTYYDENAVLRVLAEQGAGFSLDDIGLAAHDLQKVRNAIARPYGMILVTGPTGSGKTTTLYTLLKELHTSDVSIITIEDPVEYSLEGIDQIPVNSQTGLTFATGLRSILRQDPNIIMVGEIRDEETAGIAINAALTGHLLLSTLHTIDAATALPRLLDMSVETFLIASTVNIVIGQRLVRKICKECKKEKKVSLATLNTFGEALPAEGFGENAVLYTGEGCKACSQTGYVGRIGIYEVLVMSEAIREAVVGRLSATELKKLAIHEGMTTMLDDGLRKAKEGMTSIEEVLRVMHE